MYKQLLLPFETIDQLYKKYDKLCKEKDQIMLAIWAKQNECNHDLGEVIYCPQKNPNYNEDEETGFGWITQKEFPRWKRICKICRTIVFYEKDPLVEKK